MRHRRASDNKMTFTFIVLSNYWRFGKFYFSNIACTHQINNSIYKASIEMLIPSL